MILCRVFGSGWYFRCSVFWLFICFISKQPMRENKLNLKLILHFKIHLRICTFILTYRCLKSSTSLNSSSKIESLPLKIYNFVPQYPFCIHILPTNKMARIQMRQIKWTRILKHTNITILKLNVIEFNIPKLHHR